MSDIFDFISETNRQPELSDYQTDYERANYLQQLLVNHSTNGGPTNDEHYQYLRKYFLTRPDTIDKIPAWVRTNRDLSQFWQFIKFKYGKYAERRVFIRDEFSSLLEYLETMDNSPHAEVVDESLKVLNSDYIIVTWKKAIERKNSDPEGAITISRTLLESVLKHILDELSIEYPKNLDLHELYKMVTNQLNLSPEQHDEKVFKQILGGCSAIVNGLGNLRNDYGDAHGKGKNNYKPSERHAELAVNLAGSMCVFLINTYEWNKGKGN